MLLKPDENDLTIVETLANLGFNSSEQLSTNFSGLSCHVEENKAVLRQPVTKDIEESKNEDADVTKSSQAAP